MSSLSTHEIPCSVPFTQVINYATRLKLTCVQESYGRHVVDVVIISETWLTPYNQLCCKFWGWGGEVAFLCLLKWHKVE